MKANEEVEKKEDTKEPEKIEKPKPKEIEKPGKLNEKPKSMVDKIDSIEEQLKVLAEPPPSKLKKKSFKFPGKVKRNTRNLKKMMEKNKVQVIMLKVSGAANPTIGEINAGRLIVGENYWNAADDITWFWLGKVPTVIICEWDMQPLTKRRLMDDTEAIKSWLHPQTIGIRAIVAKTATEGAMGKKMNLKVLIIAAVIGLVAYYLFVGGGI